MRSFRSTIALAVALAACSSPEPETPSADLNAFAPPESCAGCHAEIAATYAETGMAQAFYPATAEAMAHLGDEREYAHGPSKRTYRIDEREGRFFLQRRLDASPDEVFEKEIHYVMGSGNNARTYLHRYPNGKLMELPLGWYSQNGGELAMSPGYDSPVHGGFRREITFQCLFCHNGLPELEPGADAAGLDPLFPGRLPQGIDCQRCHGPALAHVEKAGAGAPEEEIRAAVLNPAALSRDRQLEVCMQCHLETTSRKLPFSIVKFDRGQMSYRPTEELSDFILHFDHPEGVREDKFEIAHAAYRLRKSACFQASEMTCTTCHDPHRAPRGAEAMETYSAQCRDCHPDEQARHVAAGRAQAATDCISCHMPQRRTDDVVRVVMTDHRIASDHPSGDLTAPIAEHEEDESEMYRGPVAPYYPSAPSALYEATAQVYEQVNLEAGLPRLQKILESEQPEEADFYFHLAEGYWHEGRVEASLPWYAEAIERNPRHLIARRNYAVALNRAGRPNEAKELLRETLVAFPDDLETRVNLGDTLLGLGNPQEAAAVLKRALEIDPDSPEALQNAALADAARGLNGPAIDSLRHAVLVHPEFAAAHRALGNLLIDSGRFDEAERPLRRLLELEPDDAVAHLNLGILAAQRNQPTEAERRFRRAARLDPDSVEIQYNLGTALASRNRLGEAAQAFERALAIDESYDPARLNLAVIRLNLGDLAGARGHLDRLRDSRDPRVRETVEAIERDLAR